MWLRCNAWIISRKKELLESQFIDTYSIYWKCCLIHCVPYWHSHLQISRLSPHHHHLHGHLYILMAITKTKVKVILPWLVMVSGPSDLISTFHCVTRERVLFSPSQSRYKKSEQGRPKDEAFFVQFCEKHRTIPPFVWAPATNKQKDFKASLFLSSLPFLTIILCWQAGSHTGAGPLSVCSARKQTDERRLKEHKRQSWSPFQKTRPRCTSDQPCSFVSSTASLFVCSEVEERKEFIVRRRRFSATRRSLPVSAEMFLPGTGKTGNLRHHHDGKDKQSLLV